VAHTHMEEALLPCKDCPFSCDRISTAILSHELASSMNRPQGLEVSCSFFSIFVVRKSYCNRLLVYLSSLILSLPIEHANSEEGGGVLVSSLFHLWRSPACSS
jgi:hypothetical protein